MNNYKMLVQYDGTRYNGWQKQVQATDMPSPGHPALSVSDGNAYIGWTGENDTKLYSSVYVGGQVSNAEQMNDIIDNMDKYVHIKVK